MHNWAQPKHAARHPAQGLSVISSTARSSRRSCAHTGQRIFDGNASGSNVIRRGFGIADTGLRTVGTAHNAPSLTTLAVTAPFHSIRRHCAHHVRLHFDDLALFMGQGTS